MNSVIKEDIAVIKRMLVDNTDECFCVNLESDDAGTHYTLYLVEDSINTQLVNLRMSELELSKHHVIIFLDEERVEMQRKKNG